jgi:hypothetical protein
MSPQMKIATQPVQIGSDLISIDVCMDMT